MILKDLWQRFEDNNCLGLAAELGFWFLFSLFPFLIFLIALSSFLPFAHKPDAILNLVHGFLPRQVYELIAPTVLTVFVRPNGWIAAGNLLLALWSASTAVSSLIATLNRVYGVQENRPFWKAKGTALLLTGTLSLLYLLAFALLVVGPIISRLLIDHVGWDHSVTFIFRLLRIGVITLAMLSGLSLIYGFAPNARARWWASVPGAGVALLGWLGISAAFSFYLQNFANYNRFYGTLGAVIALMMWLYLVGLMILIGGLVNAQIRETRMT